MIIIGITGTLGAGKGEVVEYLKQKHGFTHYSVRDFLIAEIGRRGLEVNRDSMRVVANELRAEHGSGYIVEEIYKKAAEAGSNAIIESIRTHGEIEVLKNKSKFFLIAVDADPNIRYERIRSRQSVTDQ